MKQLKRFTNDDIRKFGPCYDPVKFYKDDESFTALDILKREDVSFEDKLWVILRTEFVSERTMRLFAVWSYRQTLLFTKNPDPRSVECANVAEKYARGEATKEELNAARSAAWSAAWSAAESAARSAARSAAWSAAESAARSAAWSAAESAAESAARSAARSAQNQKLIEMVLNGIDTGDTVLE